MSMSLRDQLLQAGLVSQKQVEQVEQADAKRRHTQQHQSKRKTGPSPEQQRAAQQAAAARAATLLREKEIARKQQEKVDRKARYAEIRQLIEQHRIAKPESEEHFNFVHDARVRRIPADAALRARLAEGVVCLVRCDGRYELVPPAIADRIREREPKAVVTLGSGAETAPTDENDPYKDHVVPDDLMW